MGVGSELMMRRVGVGVGVGTTTTTISAVSWLLRMLLSPLRVGGAASFANRISWFDQLVDTVGLQARRRPWLRRRPRGQDS